MGTGNFPLRVAREEYLAHNTAEQLADVLTTGQSISREGEDKEIQDLRAAHYQVQRAEAAFRKNAGDLNNSEMDDRLQVNVQEEQGAGDTAQGSMGLTQTLVTRLRAVNSAQGTIVGGKIKEKWPEWLVDESFEVIKVRLGVRYCRTLKLTQYHILAASSDKGVTKVYPYL